LTGSGYTALIPRAAVQPVDMSFEKTMRFTLTAGLSVPPSKTCDFWVAYPFILARSALVAY
jgi:uncharacterized membrane protein